MCPHSYPVPPTVPDPCQSHHRNARAAGQRLQNKVKNGSSEQMVHTIASGCAQTDGSQNESIAKFKCNDSPSRIYTPFQLQSCMTRRRHADRIPHSLSVPENMITLADVGLNFRSSSVRCKVEQQTVPSLRDQCVPAKPLENSFCATQLRPVDRALCATLKCADRAAGKPAKLRALRSHSPQPTEHQRPQTVPNTGLHYRRAHLATKTGATLELSWYYMHPLYYL
ncbi:hypothetical protein DFH06DRAFT_1139227 [Mycena polygramma]|nr:hypothetical protein DFH06DRAFT_1139227 [Mycena polygramma]